MPDSVALRLGAFAVALLVAFGAALALGRAVGPLDEPGPRSGPTIPIDPVTTTHPADHAEMGS